MPRVFGEIEGVSVGDTFESRKALSQARVHNPTMAGISGSQDEGSDSIVLSGGYVDDEDHGDVIIYTGHGGRDEQTGKQIADQELTLGNKALAISFEQKLPIRVVRGAHHKSAFSPSSGYRYDGLYSVTYYWQDTGRDGFKVWRFKLERIDATPLVITRKTESNQMAPTRITTTISRLVRDSAKAMHVKSIYENRCQVCGMRIETPLGQYSEAAHIKPLGTPHNGTDHESNILCLCPNHHKMLDYHVFTIAEDFSLIGINGQLTVNPLHNLNHDFLEYHRIHFFINSGQ